MTLAIDFTQDAVDGLPLVEHLDGEPTIDTWLATLWGIRSRRSSPLCLAARQFGIVAVPICWSMPRTS